LIAAVQAPDADKTELIVSLGLTPTIATSRFPAVGALPKLAVTEV
jgi:hypothetical protein